MPFILRLLPFLRRQWWRDRFVENPLLGWEFRIHLRRPLRSPAIWFLGLIMVSLVAGLTEGLVDLVVIIGAVWDGRLDSQADLFRVQIALRGSPLYHVLRSIQALGAIPPILLGVTVGWSWAREPSRAERESLSVAPLSVRQLMGARVHIWVILLFLVAAMSYLGYTVLEIVKSSALPDSLVEGMPGQHPISLIWLAISLTTFVPFSFAIVGVATRLALGRWSPVAVGIVTYLYFVSDWGISEVCHSAWGVGVAGTAGTYWLEAACRAGLHTPIAFLTWRGLAARIARDYPLAP